MNFREEYGEFSAREAVDAITLILKRNGVQVDEESFTWTLVGALFDKGILSRKEFENVYSLIKAKTNLNYNFSV